MVKSLTQPLARIAIAEREPGTSTCSRAIDS